MAFGNMNDKGGGIHYLVILNADGTFPATLTPYTSASPNCAYFKNINESDLNTSTKETDFEDETGIARDSESTRTMKSQYIPMERHKALVDFLTFTIKDKNVLHIRDAGIVGGKYQEIFSLEKANAEANIKTPGANKSNKAGGTLKAPDADFTISSVSITALNTALGISLHAAGPVTIKVNQEFELVETTVS